MTKELTLSTQTLPYPGMDWELLRKEGLSYVQAMAGEVWTDYNTHDPGVTILETLCYAITDLSYRLAFDIQDILAANPNEQTKTIIKHFFSAKEVLTVNPVTIDDYRKLLLDIDGVKNAWLNKLQDESGQAKAVNGVYQVLIDPDDNIDTAEKEQNLKEVVTKKLHAHRNLCEDFFKIQILSKIEIIVYADIELQKNKVINTEVLMTKIINDISEYISPALNRYSLDEMLKKEIPVENIFDGVSLEKGFIDQTEFDKFNKKTEFYTSDLIRIIMINDAVKNVKNISIGELNAKPDPWVYILSNENFTPRFSKHSNGITFFKGDIPISIDPVQPTEIVKKITTCADIDFIPGKYRELNDYETIQNEFPSNYYIGESKLPESETAEREMQVKQLKAYLMFFDQILSNYFKQLDSFKKLFALNQNALFSDDIKTIYFTQNLPDIAWGKEFPHMYDNFEKEFEPLCTSFLMKNQILEHLLALFSEKFSDFNILSCYLPEKDKELTYLQKKAALLTNIAKLRRDRYKTLDYYNQEQNPSVITLKDILAQKLGFDSEKQNFYIVEHVLLRPKDSTMDNNALEYSYFISLILPKDNKYYQDPKLYEIFLSILEEEVPAHIKFQDIWMSDAEMKEFTGCYDKWIKNIGDKTLREKMIDILKQYYDKPTSHY